MNIPIKVAVRVYAEKEPCVVQSIPASLESGIVLNPSANQNNNHTEDEHKLNHPGYITVNNQSFPFAHTVPVNCSQDVLYAKSVYPMLDMFLEGFDASFVTYGQSATGKTYTMLGQGVNCVYGEAHQGIVQRCVRDIFGALAQFRDRNFAVHIGWIEVDGDRIHDLLNNGGNVACASVGEVFHWITVGLANKRSLGSDEPQSSVHSIFTLTLEQHWVTVTGLIQHRLSTASFCDLAGTNRHMVAKADGGGLVSVPQDIALQTLEQIVDDLATIEFGDQEPAYTRTILTTLLKDSFGGRAQTLLILCVSGSAVDAFESEQNIKFACKAQDVRNYVVINEFSDNNTPVDTGLGYRMAANGGHNEAAAEEYGLGFAAAQWLKLLSNAEGLFSRLIETEGLDAKERERIEEWMYLKQECSECLCSDEITVPSDRHLGPIQEESSDGDDDEEEEESGEKSSSCQQNTDNDSDSESQYLADLEDRVVQLIDEFRTKTDIMVREDYDNFVAHHPKAVLVSTDQLEVRGTASPHRTARRKSFQPGDNLKLSTQDIERLNQVAGKPSHADPFVDSSDDFMLRSVTRDPLEQLQNDLENTRGDIEAAEKQCKVLEETVQTKQELIATLSNDAHNRSGFQKKRAKLEAEYQKSKKHLSKAISQKCSRTELETLRAKKQARKQVLTEFVQLNNHEEATKKIKEHQKDLKAVKKELEALHKTIKKNRKLESELDRKIAKTTAGGGAAAGATSNALALVGGCGAESAVEVSERISQLDQVIKEKSLRQYADNSSNSDLFRHEIRQLRVTRDQLSEQKIDLKRRLSSHEEHRKLMECDESIEIIDFAMEYKNQLMCGSSVDLSASSQREKGSRMMMARLNNLSMDELRVLLYKYFQKAIDFRENSQQMEKERDLWEKRERQLKNEILNMRYENNRRVAMLHHQHEDKLAMCMRIINDAGLTDTMSSSATSVATNTQTLVDPRMLAMSRRPRIGGGDPLAGLVDPHRLDRDLAPVGHQQMVKSSGRQRHRTTEITHHQRHVADGSTFKTAAAFEKYKEKEKSHASSKFFSKIMFKTHYGAKVHDASMNLPDEQQLRQLCGGSHQSTSAVAGTKVTRQKNKLVIQQDDRSLR